MPSLLERDHFGSSVFAGSVAMLRLLAGGKNAPCSSLRRKDVPGAGGLSPWNADQVSSSEGLVKDAQEAAKRLAFKETADSSD